MVKFVWITEMTDPIEYWHTLLPLIKKGEPVIIYTKGHLPTEVIDKAKVYKNLAVEISITGWGGTWLEPRVGRPQQMINYFNKLVQVFGKNRIRLRIDPVIPTVEGVARASSIALMLYKPVKIITSMIQLYKGQEKIFTKLGIDMNKYTIKSGNALYPEKALAERWYKLLTNINPNLIGLVQFCGMPYEIEGAVHTGCIDDELLQAIGVTDYKKIAPGKQRPGCKCTIQKKQAIMGVCNHGCKYCYAHKEHALR